MINGYSQNVLAKYQATTVSPTVEMAKKTLYVKGANHTIKLKNVSSKATVTYKSSKKSVVTVTSMGVVKPVEKGTATITVTIKQNNKTYTLKIVMTVKNPSVSIAKSVASLAAGDTLTLKAKANGLKNPAIVWETSDTKVVAIGRKTGKIRTKSAGNVNLTARDTVSGEKASVAITVKKKGVIVWKDARIEKEIRRKLNKFSGDIYKYEVAGFTELDLSLADIKGVEDVVHFPNLISLNLRNNQISDIGVLGKLTNLTDLSLSYNEIGDISTLGKLTDLTSLNLDVYNLKEINLLGNLTNLTKLKFSYGRFNDISALEKLSNLTALSLTSSGISDISALEKLPNLVELYLFDNKISDINVFEKLTNR